ncbi:hypothetical protein QRX50_00370 [Amycolatopsis carbonis]|uniref:Uncharacterized protein n=1 Tax=Amycolatopsis carbonis TaxID=715471 RepID=A0A9Y2IIP5_9PSEU|nr:hypothetical protein [Amycolatopsis sp. 2-15]WIX79308.1 hypothetical protein QRX50_00370 [Amycolatopsis sp. 2-15]
MVESLPSGPGMSVRPVALGWCGLLLGFELLPAGAIQTAVGFGEGWRGLVAAPVAVVVAYGCGRLAQLVLTGRSGATWPKPARRWWCA